VAYPLRNYKIKLPGTYKKNSKKRKERV